MRWLVVFIAVCSCTTAALAQTADEFRGDFYAERDQHHDSVAAYERALETDPERRAVLLPKLARQLLWSDRARRAAELFAEHLESDGRDCDARNDYALALAWSDQLSAALEQYRRVIEECPAIRNAARVRAAMAARWEDRPSVAARLYRDVVREGSAAEAEEARVGLAHVRLMRGETRRALEEFALLENESIPAAREGAAIASARLGDLGAASTRITAAEAQGDLSRDLLDLREYVRDADLLEIRPAVHAFRDADGTTFRAGGVAVSQGWGRRGRGGLNAGRSVLSGDRRRFRATWLELHAEHRESPALAARVGVRRSAYSQNDWNPFSGEAHVIWTPSDDLRVDAAVARIIVTDNVAAIENRLRGNYASVGADYRVGRADTITAGVDRTSWSEGNHRTRVVATWRRQLEGVPRVTVEWPTLVQHYDRPFSFGLFSPRRYFETGPGVNFYRRFARVWNASVYARTGVQREDDEDLRALGIARVALERDLRDRWALRASAAWSNSNVTGSGGFRRTSVMVEIARRF